VWLVCIAILPIPWLGYWLIALLGVGRLSRVVAPTIAGLLLCGRVVSIEVLRWWLGVHPLLHRWLFVA
jgi:hypothetical protein